LRTAKLFPAWGEGVAFGRLLIAKRYKAGVKILLGLLGAATNACF
jgi:hypothetical protein